MTIQPVGSTGAVLCFSPADLSPFGFEPGGLTLEQAVVLTRSALRGAGLDLGSVMELETYPSPEGVLILAHAASRPVRFPLRGRVPHRPT